MKYRIYIDTSIVGGYFDKEFKSKDKEFDAVKMMREIRNKITSETKDMSYEEFKRYIDTKLKKSGKKSVKR
ncbi:MAG: hypothetical protein K9I68_04185 [Bacteroidales bacterium]|nr:hypothetical protein [Bacteroidales bacterium]MCF8336563.1 hypothetical protein [Bacteroidales bacterium]